MATTNDLKNGMVLNLDGQLWSVVEFQHVKPGKGRAFVRTKLKNVLSGKVVDKTFNAGVKVETANVDRRDMQYLYKDGTDFVFMDTDDLRPDPRAARPSVGDAANYLLENQSAHVATHDGAAALRRAARVGRPRDHLHRAGPAGRPLDRRHQARDPRDRRARSRCRCSSRPAPRSRSTPATGRTSAASTTERTRLRLAARSKARKRALDILFEAEQRGVNAETLLAERLADAESPSAAQPVHRRARRGRRRARGPTSTSCSPTYSQGWTLERMPAVDRAILRLGAWEVLCNDDVPDGVAISEAVALAKTLSTDESPAFVNGLLARLAEVKPTIV